MPKLEVFFDYACPYCLRGHEYLTELLPQYPGVEIEWRPCEAHPQPEQYGRHSDLCARAMLFAQERGVNLQDYHDRMYRAAITERAEIEDINVIAAIMDGLLDRDELRAAISGGRYADTLRQNNRLAWEEYGFPAVPSYRMDGRTLKSVPDIGVSKEQLAAFMSGSPAR